MKTVVVSFDVEPDYPPYLGDSHLGVDDGLPRLLDLLKSTGIPADIFFLASLCNVYPSLAKDILKMGFSLGNHSMDHRFLCLSDLDTQMRLINDSTRVIEESSGAKLATFRAPNFSFNETTLLCLEKTGYKIDSSVLPERRMRKGLFGYAYDFRGATRVPYHPSADDVRRRGSSPILEIPSTENPIVRQIPIGGGFINTYGATMGVEAVTKAEDIVVMVLHPWEFVELYDHHPSLPRWIKNACSKDISRLSQFIGLGKDRGWKFVTLEDVARTTIA